MNILGQEGMAIHELAVTKEVLNIALKHAEMCDAIRIVSISLSVGELRDIEEEWMQRYFDYTSRNTIAEGAKIKIRKLPIIVKCSDCDESYPINLRGIESSLCPNCGKNKTYIVSGRELFIEEIEVV